jgi:hypothetical protein
LFSPIQLLQQGLIRVDGTNFWQNVHTQELNPLWRFQAQSKENLATIKTAFCCQIRLKSNIFVAWGKRVDWNVLT